MADSRINVNISVATDPLIGRKMWTDYLFGVLVEAQKRRHDPAMQEVVDSPDGGRDFRWVLYEREQMLKHVNKAREGLGRAPVDESAVRDAEGQAEGHSDYTRKWALYCADLILEVNRV